MVDTLLTRFPCEHGQLFRHPINIHDLKWKWCNGGHIVRLLEIWDETCNQQVWIQADD